MSEKVEKKGVEESLEVIAWAREVVKDLGEHMSDDGKIDGYEITKTLLTNAPSAVKAFSGIGDVPDELKDLDDSEREVVVDAAMALVMQLAAVFLSDDVK